MQQHMRKGSQASITPAGGQKPPLAKNASIESTIGEGKQGGKKTDVFEDLMGTKKKAAMHQRTSSQLPPQQTHKEQLILQRL